ncbi:MAG: CHAP domain-containing protein [Acetobacter sp.]|nr:CHAP domain-containing protein [Bacteroides sp.]MCM1341146.1 CHAP domain-containing protein [Acetobacter sp.]MCM1433520.1 CHAP domain-containing protein [Clostridiales bacterium]
MKRLIKLLSILLAVLMIFSCSQTAVYAATQEQLRSKIVEIASDEVGYTGSSSYSKYGEWYGYQGGWCTTFVLWCYNKAGSSYDVKLYGNIIPSGGNCNSMISWFSNKGRYHKASSGYTPKSGDLVFFDWSGNGSSQHVGIVDYVSGSTVHTIEGNCSGKVKAREYTKKGSKPYNNISAIMGYGEPDFSSVSGGKTQKTTKKKPAKTTQKITAARTTRRTTQKTTKNTTKQTTAVTIKKTTSAHNTTQKETTATTAKTTVTKSTTASTELESLDINAPVYNLQIGDTVKLDYSVKPSSAPAVVGYFCDEEGIIEIGTGGSIKAVGTGTATVVVCANDTLYKQCDFTVTEAQTNVTKIHEAETTRKVVGKVETSASTTQKTAKTALAKIGVNVNVLEENPHIYIVPASIIGTTFVISALAVLMRRIKAYLSKKKGNK